MNETTSLPRALAVTILCLIGATAEAQQPPAPSPSAWTWTADANVFVGFNHQTRLFADFAAWESQNWFMGTGDRDLGPGRLTILGMASLEPFTVGKLVYAGGLKISAGGSPQLFQTGESFEGVPLVNYQHPHDLIMGAGATYRIVRPNVAYYVGADLVGSPTLGPTPFMHRPSARNNPQAPLSHHFLDSTHITSGVVRGGVAPGNFGFEASVFRGEEPDENRLDIDQPRLDSWAARVSWRGGPWQAQFSGGRLHEPEWFEPYDMTRLTASIAFEGTVGSRPLAATMAWGENREFTPFKGISFGYLLEADFLATGATSVYGRAEKVRKQILGLGFHPKGFGHPHVNADIDAITIGAVRDLPWVRLGRLGLGADLTLYRMGPDMVLFYDGARSAHVFIRWRPGGTAVMHVH